MKKNPPEHREFPRGNVLIWSFFFSSRYFLYWKNRRKFSSQLILCACYWVTGLWLLHLAFRDRSKAYRFIVNVKTGDGRGRNYKETVYCSYKIVKWVIEILDVVYKNDFLLSVDEVLKCSDVMEKRRRKDMASRNRDKVNMQSELLEYKMRCWILRLISPSNWRTV